MKKIVSYDIQTNIVNGYWNVTQENYDNNSHYQQILKNGNYIELDEEVLPKNYSDKKMVVKDGIFQEFQETKENLLQQAKDNKIKELKQIINYKCDNATIDFNNKIIDADWESGININATITTMEKLSLDNVNWKCADNTFIILTLSDIINIGGLIFTKQNNYRNVIKEQYRTMINNATTIEEIEEIDLSVIEDL